MVEPEDKLCIENNHVIKSQIGDEKIYFSDIISKINNSLFTKTQQRILVITDLALYTIKGNDIKRRIKIEDLKGITVSKTSNQFIIHGNQNEYDYLLIYENRKKLINILQSLYESLTNKDLLFCQKNEKDLTKYEVTKKERAKNPYLFKIEQTELTSIKDYIENESSNKEEDEEPLPPRTKSVEVPVPDKKSDYSDNTKFFESNKIKDVNSTSNIILNKDINSNEELIKQLNEEKNKNKQLLNELNNEKKKVIELTNKIKLLENNNNNNIKRINDLEKLINEKGKELIFKIENLPQGKAGSVLPTISFEVDVNGILILRDLKSKNEKNDLENIINPGEEVMAVNFTSCENDINCPMPCKNTTLVSRLEEKLYNDYPRYKDFPTYLTVNGTIVSRFKTLEENGIKNGNTIIVKRYD